MQPHTKQGKLPFVLILVIAAESRAPVADATFPHRAECCAGAKRSLWVSASSACSIFGFSCERILEPGGVDPRRLARCAAPAGKRGCARSTHSQSNRRRPEETNAGLRRSRSRIPFRDFVERLKKSLHAQKAARRGFRSVTVCRSCRSLFGLPVCRGWQAEDKAAS
jgi:hypothetical protein